MEMSPKRWANTASTVLRAGYGADCYPVDISQLALDWSKVLAPDEAVSKVSAHSLEGFEGALIDGRSRNKGWGIFYSDSIQSSGRQRFTIAHEFGHWLMHRHDAPQTGFECQQEDMFGGRGEVSQEIEANQFAACVLMPLDDFRQQIPARKSASLDDLGQLAESRYDVSLTACIIRWLEYTECEALLVVTTEDFVLWAKPSSAALRAGHFIRTRNVAPVEVPAESLLRCGDSLVSARAHPKGVWFDVPVREEVIISDRYDLGFSLLTFGNNSARADHGEESEPDLLDQFIGF